MNLGTFIDGLIAPMLPGLADRRAAARLRYMQRRIRAEMLSTYAAATKRRVEKDWAGKTTSADSAIVADLPLLRGRARAAVRDDWAASSAQAGWRRNVVGIGITPRSAARSPADGTPLADFNAAIDDLWEEWADDQDAFDVEGRKIFLELQNLWVNELVTVGESFTLLNYVGPRETVGLTIQCLEPEQLDSIKAKHEEREVRGGIEIDEYGKAVGYHFHTGVHPVDRYSTTSSRVEADRVIHIFRVDRVRQTHGVTWLASVLRKLRFAGMYDEYMLVKARIEAAFGGVVTQADDVSTSTLGLAGPAGETETDANDNVRMNLEPGMMPVLAPGQSITFPPPMTPNSMYEPFTREQIKQIAAGAGLDYGTLARWFADGNFSSQRQGMLETYKETDPVQRLLVAKGLRRIRQQFKEIAVLEDRVAAPKFFTDPAWRRAYLKDSWQGPPKPWIDPAKQAAGAKLTLDNFLGTRRDVLNERGQDWRETFRQIKEERDYATELELTIPGLNAPAKTSPVEPRPGKKPPAPDAGDDDDELSGRLVEEIIAHAIGSDEAEAAMR